MSQADLNWFDDVFPKVKDNLKLGDRTSLTLPWKNDICGFEMAKQTLKTVKHIYEVPVQLCATGIVAGNGKPVGKIFRVHYLKPAVDDEVEKSLWCLLLKATAYYNGELGTTLVEGVIESLKNDT